MFQDKYNPLVISLDSIPENGCKIVIYNDLPIAIFRKGKKIYAIDNRCPHRSGSLGDGEIKNDIVTCPVHQWKFKISTGICVQNDKITIDRYQVEVINEKVKIDLQQ